MSIDIEMSGSGKLGDIAPGWSVQESITPVILGDTSSSTGVVTFSAASKDDSLFVINNEITTTHDELGQISGIVKSVSQTGLTTNITHNTKLASYDAEKNIPGLFSRKTYSGIDLITQLSGNEIRLKPGLSGGFWSLQGHNAGFDSLGNILEPSESTNINGFKWIDHNGNTRNNYWITAINSINGSAARFLSNNKQYCRSVWADTLSTDVAARSYRIAFKTFNESTSGINNVTWSWGTMAQDGLADSIKYSEFTLNKVAKTLDVAITYTTAGMVTNFSNSVNLSSLDWDKEMAVFFEFDGSDGTFYAGEGYRYSYKITVCNTDNYSSYVTYSKTVAADWFALWHGLFNWQTANNGNGGITSQDAALGIRSVWWRNSSDAFVIEDWENPQEFTATESYRTGSMVLASSSSVDVPGVKQNMWQWIQDMCSAFTNTQVYIENDVLTIGYVGERIIDISNTAGPLTITPNTTLSGKNVGVTYNNCVFYPTTGSSTDSSRVEIYNAYNDNNRVLKVNVGEIVTTTVETNFYVNTVISPNISLTIPAPKQGYNVSDSTGLPANSGWYGAGGRVFATKNKDNPYAIDIKVIGPAANYGGYTGPYSIALVSNDKEYASLRIVGSGHRVNKQTLNLQTGATPEKTPVDVAKTIDNVWNITLSNAYNSGLFASLDASGPRVTISGSIPTSSINGFGLTAGSLFTYRDSIYRISDCTIGNLTVSFNAVRHVSVADFDAVWSGKTVALHDFEWENNDVSDQIIRPLYIASDVNLMLDTDGVTPYMHLSNGYDNIYLDDDGVPYFKPEQGATGYRLIYLDDDATVYYV